jgi:hypothetical protein
MGTFHSHTITGLTFSRKETAKATECLSAPAAMNREPQFPSKDTTHTI